MTILVTGATGFLGGAVARKLLERGERVRVLARDPQRAGHLRALGAEVVRGDILDAGAVLAAMRGVDTLYHLAAVYQLWHPRPAEQVRVAVEGTRNALHAAQDEGVRRVVYTSSSITIGEEPGTVGTEATVHRGWHISNYERAKVAAELVARDYAERGLPVVILNPASVYGPGDVGPFGRAVVQAINGQLPLVMKGPMSFAYVDDAVQAHLLAAAHGTPGRRYLIAERDVHTSDYLNEARALVGLRPLPVAPAQVLLAAGRAMDLAARVTGRPPMLPLDALRVLHAGMRIDGTQAARDLGLTYTPMTVGLPRALDWYHRNGHIRRGLLVRPADFSGASSVAGSFMHAPSVTGATGTDGVLSAPRGNPEGRQRFGVEVTGRSEL